MLWNVLSNFNFNTYIDNYNFIIIVYSDVLYYIMFHFESKEKIYLIISYIILK